MVKLQVPSRLRMLSVKLARRGAWKVDPASGTKDPLRKVVNEGVLAVVPAASSKTVVLVVWSEGRV